MCIPFWCLLLLLLLQGISPGEKQAAQELQAIVQLLLLWSLHQVQQMLCLLETNCSEQQNQGRMRLPQLGPAPYVYVS